jgi:hypothetical protein
MASLTKLLSPPMRAAEVGGAGGTAARRPPLVSAVRLRGELGHPLLQDPLFPARPVARARPETAERAASPAASGARAGRAHAAVGEQVPTRRPVQTQRAQARSLEGLVPAAPASVRPDAAPTLPGPAPVPPATAVDPRRPSVVSSAVSAPPPARHVPGVPVLPVAGRAVPASSIRPATASPVARRDEEPPRPVARPVEQPLAAHLLAGPPLVRAVTPPDARIEPPRESRGDRPPVLAPPPELPSVAAQPPQREQVVRVLEPAPRPPGAVAPAGAEPRPAPPAILSAPPPPRQPTAGPAPVAPTRPSVSIEIGRIEIRSTRPRAAPPPRRVRSARQHVIDPGLRFGGSRRW